MPSWRPGAVKGLAADGLTPAPARPRPVTLYDLEQRDPRRELRLRRSRRPRASGSISGTSRRERRLRDGARERIVAARRAPGERAGRRPLTCRCEHAGFIDLPAHAGSGRLRSRRRPRADRADLRRPHRQRRGRRHRHRGAEVHRLHSRAAGGGRRARGRGARPGLHVESRREHGRRSSRPSDHPAVEKIDVGMRPNGLAYDPQRRRLLVAHVGDPAIPGSYTVSVVDVPRPPADRRHRGRRSHPLGGLRSGRGRLPRQHRRSAADRHHRRRRATVRRVVTMPQRRASRPRHRRHPSPAVLRVRRGGPARGGRGQRQGPRQRGDRRRARTWSSSTRR